MCLGNDKRVVQHINTYMGLLWSFPDSCNDMTLSISHTPGGSIKWHRMVISIIRHREISRSDLEKLIGKLGVPPGSCVLAFCEDHGQSSIFRIILDSILPQITECHYRNIKMAGIDFNRNAAPSSVPKTDCERLHYLYRCCVRGFPRRYVRRCFRPGI